MAPLFKENSQTHVYFYAPLKLHGLQWKKHTLKSTHVPNCLPED